MLDSGTDSKVHALGPGFVRCVVLFTYDEGRDQGGGHRERTEQGQADGVAVGVGVVSGAHDYRWEEAAESACGTDDSSDRSDSCGGRNLGDPGEH